MFRIVRANGKTSLLKHSLRVTMLSVWGAVLAGSVYAYTIATVSSPASHTSKQTQVQTAVTKKSAPASPPPVAVTPVVAPAAPASKPIVSPPAPVVAPPVVVPAPTSSVSNLVPDSSSAASIPPPADPAAAPASSSAPASSPPGTPPAPVSYSSTNWAGYLAANGTYTSVAGSWTAPLPTGTGVNTSADAAWIGIGGVTSGDLVQIGTDNTVSRSGQVYTEAFYEMLPAASVPVPNMTVTPGDVMTASVAETSTNQWLLTITDTTTAQTFNTTVAYTSSHSSAEWIEEDPSYSNGRQVPFDFFGTVPFSGASMTVGGATSNLAAANASPITMLNRAGHTVAAPSAIGSDGASFAVTRAPN